MRELMSLDELRAAQSSWSAEALPELRFVERDGQAVLQQRWALRSVSNGFINDLRLEWRDVPLEKDDG